MKIWGNRVYLSVPPPKEYKVSVPDHIKAQEQQEYLEKLDRLEVFNVGAEVKNIKIGDIVQVDPIGLRRGRQLKIGDDLKISVEENEIMHTW